MKPGAIISGLSMRVNGLGEATPLAASERTGLVRVADVPIYRSDAIARHAPALQEMRVSAPPKAWMNPADVQRLGLADGVKMKCVQGGRASAILEIASDARVAPGVVRLSAAHALSSELGPMIGPIELEAA